MRKFGILCVTLGVALLLAALGLLLYNNLESQSANDASMSALVQIQNAQTGEAPVLGNAVMQSEHVDVFDQVALEAYAEMTVKEIDGYGYIGYLSIPALALELPVMDTWDYTRLRLAPCREYGAVRSEDLVIAAHNYATHFGNISKLVPGDLLTFTDMDETAFLYNVKYVDLVQPTDVEKVKNSGFDLVLYTCTYGGENRICVFCDLVEV